MAGKWASQNKARPGVYVNLKSTAPDVPQGLQGVVALPLDLDWGPEQVVQEITAATDTRPIFGEALTSIQPLAEALKRAVKVLAFRLNANTGIKATGTVGNLITTAKYSGTTGNTFNVVIVSEGGGLFTVNLYLGTELVEQQVSIDTVANLADSLYVDWTGTGVLTATAGTALASGTTIAVTAGNHGTFRTTIEPYQFNTFGLYDVTDSGIKDSYKAWVIDQVENQGNMIHMYVAGYVADYEAITNVKNGVVLADGTILAAAQAVAWVAGASAAAGSNGDLTYSVYEGTSDVDTKYTGAQIEAAIVAGEFVFTAKDGKARVEYDINSLTTTTAIKNSDFKANRVVRALFGWIRDVANIAEVGVIGQLDNNDNGRNVLKGRIIGYMDDKIADGTFTNFDAAVDLLISAGLAADATTIEGYLEPVGSINKIYVNAYVR